MFPRKNLLKNADIQGNLPQTHNVVATEHKK